MFFDLPRVRTLVADPFRSAHESLEGFGPKVFVAKRRRKSIADPSRVGAEESDGINPRALPWAILLRACGALTRRAARGDLIILFSVLCTFVVNAPPLYFRNSAGPKRTPGRRL
jgi:hypothetical protein